MDQSAELMLLGFISLLLTVGMGIVSKICIPARFGGSMLPCRASSDSKSNEKDKGDASGKGGGDPDHNRRKLLWSLAEDMLHRRALAAASGGDDYCTRHVRPRSVKFLRSNLNEAFYRSQSCFGGYWWSSRLAGEDTTDLSIRAQSAPHIHIRPRRLPHPLQCDDHGTCSG